MKKEPDFFRSKYNIGQTIYPENKSGSGEGLTSDDLYASDLDEADAEFVSETFGLSGDSSDGVLCCAACFTPVCYKCKININGYFQSSEAVNTSVVELSEANIEESLSDTDLSVKRVLDTEGPTPKQLVARCDECQNIVAVVDGNSIYHFRRIIASPP